MWPIDDWQFWAVTLIGLGVLGLMLRGVLQGRKRGCAGCAVTVRKQA